MKIIASAKINLHLHITDQRADGYHLLNSLFAFTAWGDGIIVTPSKKLSLDIHGPFASHFANADLENNLIFRAATLLKNHCGVNNGAHIHLIKNIPIAAGLGGGSSDAATVLKELNILWALKLDLENLSKIGLQIGADVPVCLHQKTALVSGIGEKIQPTALPFKATTILLINPKLPLSTQSVFKRYAQNHTPYSRAFDFRLFNTVTDWSAFQSWLSQNHNDLETPAIALLPEIATILQDLRQQPFCFLTRMSGSGPTCFGLFPTMRDAKHAMRQLMVTHPNYWMIITKIIW